MTEPEAREFMRLKEEDRIRRIREEKNEENLIAFLRLSITELEAAATRLEHMVMGRETNAG